VLIGSGTRLALEDVQALVNAIAATGGDIRAASPLYEERRKPIVEKLLSAAARSAGWYEHFEENSFHRGVCARIYRPLWPGGSRPIGFNLSEFRQAV